jgi:ribA/ribD-fused uncharacterized protein
MKRKNGFVLFWGGIFSQWYPHKMTIDGVEYNCCEQYMMAEKARTFGDAEALEAIMKSSDPKYQKAVGKSVKNFSGPLWDRMCREVVFRANLEKFSDPELKKYLFSFGNEEIVEASPYDKIWGIGLSEDDPDALDKSKWKGTNFLGEAIMQAREALRSTNEIQQG